MCQTCFSRRRFLAMGGASLALAGCDGPPPLVSDAKVEQMGLAAWSEIRAKESRSGNANLQDALDRVAVRLLREEGESPRDWEFVVFASPRANAFALPGGKIGVYEGMFRVADTQDRLAAIVGHEIGHLKAEHSQKRISAEVAKDTGVQLLAFALNLADVQFAGEIAGALGMGAELGLLMPYNRNQELEADLFGLELMNAAGFDAREAVTVWRRMEQATRDRPPEFLATHPAPASRIRAIEEMLPSL